MAQNDEFVIDVVTNFKSKGTKEVYDSFKILNKRIKELATGPISKEIAKNIKREIDAITKELKHSGIFNRGFDPHLQTVAIRRAEERISALRSPNRAYSRINNLVDDISTDFGRTIRSSLLDEREGNFAKTSNKLNKIVIREEKTRYNERAKNELKLEKMRQKEEKLRQREAIEEREETIATNRYNTLFKGTGNELFSWFANTLGLSIGLTGNRNSWVLNFAKSRRDEDIFADANKTKINYGNLSLPKMIMTGIDAFNSVLMVADSVAKIYQKLVQWYNTYLTQVGRNEQFLKQFEKRYQNIRPEVDAYLNDNALILAASRDQEGIVGDRQGSASTFNMLAQNIEPDLARRFVQANLGSIESVNAIYNKYGITGARDTATLMNDFLNLKGKGGVYRYNSKTGYNELVSVSNMAQQEILAGMSRNMSTQDQMQLYDFVMNPTMIRQLATKGLPISEWVNSFQNRQNEHYRNFFNPEAMEKTQNYMQEVLKQDLNRYLEKTGEIVSNLDKVTEALVKQKDIETYNEVEKFHKDFQKFSDFMTTTFSPTTETFNSYSMYSVEGNLPKPRTYQGYNYDVYNNVNISTQ